MGGGAVPGPPVCCGMNRDLQRSKGSGIDKEMKMIVYSRHIPDKQDLYDLGNYPATLSIAL